MLYLQMLSDQIGAMGDIFASITKALGAAHKIFELLERQPAFACEDAPLVHFIPTGHVEFRNVSFTYEARPNRRILNGLSLTIPAGKVIALVGPSGHGKSTILGLLQRLYMQQGGDILLDNTPIRKFGSFAYHQYVCSVSQEPVLFARSIRENILLGILDIGQSPTEAQLAAVRNACILANALDFIEALPNGFDTQVGSRGVQLSGGQKQRIAIARALVRQPKVLLLDEATSALDADSERQVQDALDKTMAAGLVTVVVVAHRLSTVRNADVIYVIENGQVSESGSHEELISKEKGVYRKLVQNQMH